MAEQDLISGKPNQSEVGGGYGKVVRLIQAISHGQKSVIEGYKWFASIDPASFFDEIPHNLILKFMCRKIADDQLVTLIR